MFTDRSKQKAEVVKITSRKNRFVHMTTCVTHTFVLVHAHNTCASGFSLSLVSTLTYLSLYHLLSAEPYIGGKLGELHGKLSFIDLAG